MDVCVSLDYYRIESEVATKYQMISGLLTRIIDAILLVNETTPCLLGSCFKWS